MPSRTDAEEHLRIIRSLMEKATIYRAISAPTALIGGLCSVFFGGWLHLSWRPLPSGVQPEACGRCFVLSWITVLVLTMAANGVLIWQAARKRHEPFISPAMRKALWALLPPMLCGAFFALLLGFLRHGDELWNLPPIWMTCYGLGLLATAQFAPKSIPILGWCFLLSGLGVFAAEHWLGRTWGESTMEHARTANFLMIGTFGLFHLIYAACTWARQTAEGDNGGTP